MSFEEVSAREMVLAQAASITMVSRNGCPAYALLSLSSVVGKDLTGWARGGKASLQIGKGTDTGKIRIVAKPDGDLTFRQMRHPHTWQLVLGHHAIFGTEPRKGHYTAARAIDRNTVEIDLPAWGASTARKDGPLAAAKAVQAAKEWSDEVRVGARGKTQPATLPVAPRLPPIPPPAKPERARVVSVPTEPAKAPVAAPPPPLRRHTEREGVTLGPAPNAHIGHANRGGIPLTEVQALFLEPLVVALGSLIPTSVIMQRSGLRAEEITWAVCDIQPALKCIGLRLQYHKPFYILKKE